MSLDVPSELDATTGQAPGILVRPNRVLTLALPKTGLASLSGELWVANIGIPREVYDRVGVPVAPFHGEARMTQLCWQEPGPLPKRQQEERQ